MPLSCLHPFGPFETPKEPALNNPLLKAPSSDKICLLGPMKSGKTTFALKLAKDFKNPVYINYNDMRLNQNILSPWLLKWHLEKKMDLLILDRIERLDFSLPKLPKIILIPNYLTPIMEKDFSLCYALGLNFKEYTSFFKPNTPKNTLFNRFLRDGNALDSLFIENEQEKILKKQENIQLIFQAYAPLMAKICSYQSKFVSAFYLYTQFKKELKISKDTLYKLLHALENQRILFLVPSFENHKTKLYLCDFALPYSLTPSPSLLSVFENMVFLELYKQFPKYELHSHDNGIFILHKNSTNKLALIAHAFPTPHFLEKQLSWCHEHGFLNIVVVSINAPISANNPPYKHLNFIDFSLDIQSILV
ncbi:ATP-binding protein [Helicobacter pylori]|uniref:ATP-binding protein n=1 Tax=Helicobacter pylori TaxID=210 RepID=UPI00099201D6|nr:ATP-binding protein [Helicobacter pylori]OOQ33419.1 ATP-binding protein [Helicobacter pylori]PDW58634.1 ATP-binding protein [Helicobacter pylori]WQU51892.1 ATP-binding protein [Helicobacter pylori]